MDFPTIIAGFQDALTLTNLMFVVAGVVLGQIVGAMPGIGPIMTMAIAIPFTFVLGPLSAISFLVGVNKGGLIGGAIPAILINTPGTPDAAATALDGFPLARKGKPVKALKMALYSSVTGDTFSDLVLITVSAPLAIIALKMGPVEIFSVMVFAFAVISGMIGSSVARGIFAAALGLFCATVGLDPQHATPRLIFGFFDLYDGFPIGAVAIGSLAVSEILARIATPGLASRPAVSIPKNQSREDRGVSLSEYLSCKFVLLRGALIGTTIGAIPGMGSTAAAFMSYASTKQSSKEPEKFGTGELKGIAATESANSSVAGADFIPLLTLGLPGSAAAAIMIGAFIIQGIQPGPLLFSEQGRLVYGMFCAMVMANAANLLVGLFGLRLWSIIATAPSSIVFASALSLCAAGVYIASGGFVGIWVMVMFAFLGLVMMAMDIPVVVFIIAFFLGPRFELSLVQTSIILRGDMTRLTNHPVAILFLVMSVLVVYWLGFHNRRKQQSA